MVTSFRRFQASQTGGAGFQKTMHSECKPARLTDYFVDASNPSKNGGMGVVYEIGFTTGYSDTI